MRKEGVGVRKGRKRLRVSFTVPRRFPSPPASPQFHSFLGPSTAHPSNQCPRAPLSGLGGARSGKIAKNKGSMVCSTRTA